MKVKLYHKILVKLRLRYCYLELKHSLEMRKRLTHNMMQQKSLHTILNIARLSILSLLKDCCTNAMMHAESYAYFAHVWTYNRKLATKMTWQMIKLRDKLREKYKHRSRKYWLPEARLRRIIATGTDK